MTGAVAIYINYMEVQAALGDVHGERARARERPGDEAARAVSHGSEVGA